MIFTAARRIIRYTPKHRRRVIAPKVKKTLAPAELEKFILKILDGAKAEDITSIDLKNKSPIADYMIIANGRSARQVAALGKKLREELSPHGISVKLEGMENGDWVVADAGDVIVHLFRPEVREFYNLDKLWSVDFSSADVSLYRSA